MRSSVSCEQSCVLSSGKDGKTRVYIGEQQKVAKKNRFLNGDLQRAFNAFETNIFFVPVCFFLVRYIIEI